MTSEQIAKDAFELLLNKSKTLVELPKSCIKGETGILFYLEMEKDKEVTPGKLCELLDVTTPRIASILNALENKECVIRKQSEFDKRKIIVFITKKGEDKVKKEKEKIIKIMTEIIEKFGEEKTNEYLKLSLELEGIIKDIDEKEKIIRKN